MNTHYIPAASLAPPPVAIRLPALFLTLWTNAMRAAFAVWSARATRRRDEDTLDRLDARALRDIGAERFLAERCVRCERDELQWRIDSQFRG